MSEQQAAPTTVGQIAVVASTGKTPAAKGVSASKAEGALKSFLTDLNARITTLETENQALRKAIKGLGGKL